MKEAGERFYTPNELAEQGIMSLVKQWQERRAGRLGAYRIGVKILYGQHHLDSYLALCDKPAGGKEEAQHAA